MDDILIYHSPVGKEVRNTIVGNVEDNVLFVAVSRCSPLDNFSRKEGIKRATERLEKGEYRTIVPLDKIETEETTVKKFLRVAAKIDQRVEKRSYSVINEEINVPLTA